MDISSNSSHKVAVISSLQVPCLAGAQSLLALTTIELLYAYNSVATPMGELTCWRFLSKIQNWNKLDMWANTQSFAEADGICLLAFQWWLSTTSLIIFLMLPESNTTKWIGPESRKSFAFSNDLIVLLTWFCRQECSNRHAIKLEYSAAELQLQDRLNSGKK